MRFIYHSAGSFFQIIMLMTILSVVCKKIYIISSSNQTCPDASTEQACLTLQQFASNSSTGVPMPSELILELLPGSHSLQTGILVVGLHTNTFIMNGSDATVQCSGSLSSMEFPNVEFIKISALNFTNCGRADFYNVSNIYIENCNFFNWQRSWSLDMISNATVVRSSFLNGEVGPVLRIARSFLFVKFSVFVNTTAGSGSVCAGAAINCQLSVLNVEQSDFLHNRVDCLSIAKGGAIYAFDTNVSITDCTFTNNTALISGGAVYIDGGSLQLSNSLFEFNSVDGGTGGALHLYTMFNSVSIRDSRFLNNSAASIYLKGSGGAIYVAGQSSNISLIDTTFSKNSAAFCGALRISNSYDYHSVSIINGNFTYNRESRMIEKTSTVTTYTQFGGVACINDSNISIINSNFTENQAAGHAGVLHIENSTLLVQGSIFFGNRAQHNGGVIFTMQSSVAIAVEHSSFTYNQAGGDGGVLYMRSAGKSGNCQIAIVRSRFGFNNAARRGGVIAITGGRIDLQKMEIYNNTAESGGVVSACISEVKVQTKLRITDDPTNPQLCTFYDTEDDLENPESLVIPHNEKHTLTLNAALGIAITVSVLVLILYAIVTCVILYLCGILKCNRGLLASSNIDNTEIYVPINELHDQN